MSFTDNKNDKDNNSFVFKSRKQQKKPENKPAKKEEKIELSEEDKFAQIVNRIRENNKISKAYGNLNVVDWLKYGGKIEDFAREDKTEYPNHIDHWNKNSDKYIPAPRLF